MNLFKNVYKNKKVLLTGDTGFKGSWLAIWLNELGAQVYGYALPPKTQRDNFVITKLNEKINHEDGDIRDKEHLVKFFNDIKPDIAFHLAAQPLVIDSYNDPHYTFGTNLMGTVNFFESVRTVASVKVAVNITSDKCYQNNEWNRGYKETDAMGGKDPYSASKGCSELITNAYQNSFFQFDETCNIASARAGNVLGGGDWADFRIVPDFFRAIEKNETLFLRYPYATRPWQHVLEPLSGYLLLAAKLYQEGKKFSGGWNFGPSDRNNYTVKELIEEIIRITIKGKYEVDKEIDKLHEAGLLKLDISKAKSYLGWDPVLDFGETVKLTVEGYLIEKEHDIYEKRIQQIVKYVELAKQKNIEWAISNQCNQ